MNTLILHTCASDASPEGRVYKRWHGVEDNANLPCWAKPETFIAACYLAITAPEGRDVRKRLGYVSVENVMRVVSEDAKTADSATGRNVMTSHATVARRLMATGTAVSTSVVKRARQVIERLGLAATVVEGRYLSAAERTEKQAEGKNQWRIASTRHLLVPRIWADALDRVRTDPTTYLLIKSYFPRTSSDKPHQKRPKPTKKPQRQAPAPLPYRRLAAKLAQRLPWLARLPYLGGVARILMASGISPEHWTAHDVVTVLDTQRKKLGWATPGTVKNPHGWLKFLLAGFTPEVIEAHVSQREALQRDVEARRLSALSAGPRKAPTDAQRAVTSRGAALVRAVLRQKRSATEITSPSPASDISQREPLYAPQAG